MNKKRSNQKEIKKEGSWKEVVDFTKFKKSGVQLKKILKKINS